MVVKLKRAGFSEFRKAQRAKLQKRRQAQRQRATQRRQKAQRQRIEKELFKRGIPFKAETKGGVGADVVTTKFVVIDGKRIDLEETRRKSRGRGRPITRVITPTARVTERIKKIPIVEKLPTSTALREITRKKEFKPTPSRGIIAPTKPGRIEKARRKLVGITQKKPGKPEAVLAGTVGLGAVGFAQGVKNFADALRNPKKFVKEQIEFVKQLKRDPKGTTKAVVKEFENNPAGFIGEFAGFVKSAGLTGKLAKDSPVGRVVSEEIFIRNQPKELQGPTRAILKTSKAQEKIGFTTKTKPKKVDFAEVKELTKAEQKAVKKALQLTDSVVFGSAASRLLTGKLTKVPKDVDLATSNINKFNKAFLDSLPSKAKLDLVIKKESIVRKSTGEKLFDVKPIERLIPDKGLITRKGKLPVTGLKEQITFFKDSQLIIPKKEKVLTVDQFIPTQKLQTIEGIKFVGLGEQTARKGLGTLQVLLEKNPRRAKDPAAFIESLEVQIAGLKKKKPKTIVGRTLNKRKIAELQKGLKVLKNKDFAKLLESKVPGITKEFPIISKIEVKKLKKAQKVRDRQTIDVVLETDKFKFKEIGKKPVSKKPFVEKPAVLKKKPSKLPAIKKKVSKLPSILPKKKVVSKISALPIKKKPSKIPPSKIPKKPKPSKLPTPKVTVSKLPSALPSKIPKAVITPSKLPPSRKRVVPVIPPKKPLIPFKKETKKKIVKKVKKTKEAPIFLKFTPTITAPRRRKKNGKKLKENGVQLFTGLEFRG